MIAQFCVIVKVYDQEMLLWMHTHRVYLKMQTTGNTEEQKCCSVLKMKITISRLPGICDLPQFSTLGISWKRSLLPNCLSQGSISKNTNMNINLLLFFFFTINPLCPFNNFILKWKTYRGSLGLKRLSSSKHFNPFLTMFIFLVLLQHACMWH